MLIKNENVTRCFHCGDKCDSEKVLFEDKHFCCDGCRLVFEILSENDLGDFYKLTSMPGISLKGNFEDGKYKYLDNKVIADQLLQFQSNTKNVIMFHIPVIHCSSCILLLENLEKLMRGIYHSRVNFPKKSVTVTYDPREVQLRGLVSFLARIGYEPMINMEENEGRKPKRHQHDTLLKIGIAGFCFGNIMLLAFPEYLGFSALDTSLKHVFSYLSALLSLPVLYAGSSYLKAAYKAIRDRFFNIDIPIALGIATLWIRSCYEVFILATPGYFDSLAGLVFFLLIGKWFQSKTYHDLMFERDYKSYFPLAVDVLLESKTMPLPVRQLKPGDVIAIKNNEIIPADSELLSETANIDYSFVTGESAPQLKSKSDHIYAGGKQKGLTVTLKVKKSVSQSYLTQLWNHPAFEKKESNHHLFINKISKYFTLAIILIAFIAAIFWFWVDPSKIVNVFTAVLIVACPCALALSAPFTLGAATRVFGKAGCYLKNADIIEKMSNLSTLVFDKTGTITYNDQSDLEYEGKDISALDLQVIKGMVMNSSHPLSKTITASLHSISPVVIENFEEVEGKGLVGWYHNKCYKVGSAQFVNVNTTDHSINTNVFIKKSNEVIGRYMFKNNYRAHLEDVINKLKENYRLGVLSGDNDNQRFNLSRVFGTEAALYFDKKPDEKLQILKIHQDRGEKVMMIGDGLNDAGALQQSDVGLVLADDINNFTPASDGILAAKAFEALPLFLQLSRVCKKIIYASFILSFLYNMIGLSFAVAGMLTPIVAAILMPLSSISVVLFTTFFVNFHSKRLKLLP